MMFYSFGQVRATMLRPRMRTSSNFNTQRATTRRNRVATARNMLHPTMLRYVGFKCCDCLAGACKCRNNNVGIWCAEMLRSFGWGLKDLLKLRPKDRNISTQPYHNIVGGNLLRAHVRLTVATWTATRWMLSCWLKFDHFKTWANSTQHVTTEWPNGRNLLHPTLRWNVSIVWSRL